MQYSRGPLKVLVVPWSWKGWWHLFRQGGLPLIQEGLVAPLVYEGVVLGQEGLVGPWSRKGWWALGPGRVGGLWSGRVCGPGSGRVAGMVW